MVPAQPRDKDFGVWLTATAHDRRQSTPLTESTYFDANTETLLSPSRFAKSGYRFWSAQKFFRARHVGHFVFINGVCATINQYLIRSASKCSRISFPAFIRQILRKGDASPGFRGKRRYGLLVLNDLVREAPDFCPPYH